MEGRPAVWIGHAILGVSNVERAADFWRALGMREIERGDEVAIMELRGGTHLILVPGTLAAGAPFDLMVDDISATHAEYRELGLDPSPLEQGRNHLTFTVTDPDGQQVTVNSSHVVGEV